MGNNKKVSKKQNPIIDNILSVSGKYPTIPIILVMFIAFTISSPYFLTVINMKTIMAANSVIMIAAIGQTLVLLTGGIDLSVSTVISASAVVAGTVMANTGNIFLGIVCAIGVGLVFGMINGALVGYLGLTPFITTMGTQLVARGIAFVASQGIAVKGTPRGVIDFGFYEFIGIPGVTWISIILIVITTIGVTKTSWGRHVILLGSNKSAAKYSGLKVKKIEMSVYALSGLLAGIAGFISVANLGFALPGAGDKILLIIIGGVVIGGTSMNGGEGSIIRTLLGITLLSVMTSGLDMMGIPFYDQLIIQGILIFIGNWLSTKFSGRTDLAI